MNRFGRQIEFFGKEGQEKLAQIKVCVVGAGGLGSHVAQQLAFLGISHIVIIDHDPLSDSNFNRLIGVHHDDKVGTPKVDILYRLVKSIDKSIKVETVPGLVNTPKATKALLECNYVIGCVDNDGARLFLNELCLAYNLPYFDLATEIHPENTEYGGRVVFVNEDPGCLMCIGEIDQLEASKFLQSKERQQDHENIYGVAKNELEGSGPSVVTLNGVIASMGCTEFMVNVTGVRRANKKVSYHGASGIISRKSNEYKKDCYYCNVVRNMKDKVNIEKYFLEN
jgi:molybdopterin-synthase adenylyltransferase